MARCRWNRLDHRSQQVCSTKRALLGQELLVSELVAEQQRRFAFEIVRRLRKKGFEAYWAGGCVRDQLLGLVPKDYDVATNARPADIRQIFGPRRTIAIGAAFGVVSVIGPREAGQVEVATFRRDGGYSDGRHPDSVAFSTPEEDAARRDFTINGLFYDPLVDRVIDFVGGRADLQEGIIRAIGDPRARFGEDKLRMLRAVRFAAGFRFRLDEATRVEIIEMAHEVTVVSVERIAQEFRGMLTPETRREAAVLLWETRLLETLLPEVAKLERTSAVPLRATGTLWELALDTLGALRHGTFESAMAALLMHAGRCPGAAEHVSEPSEVSEDVGAQLAERIATRWRMSNRELETIAWLAQSKGFARRDQRWSKVQRLLIRPAAHDLVNLHEAQQWAVGGSDNDVVFCRERLAQAAEELNPPPLLTGHDLIARGIRPNEHFRELLDAVRDAQLDGHIRTKEDALAFAEQIVAQWPQ